MRPRKVYAVYEYCSDGQGYREFRIIRCMFYNKDTANSYADLLRKQQDLNDNIAAQLEKHGLERTCGFNSIFTVEEWEIADGDEDH